MTLTYTNKTNIQRNIHPSANKSLKHMKHGGGWEGGRDGGKGGGGGEVTRTISPQNASTVLPELHFWRESWMKTKQTQRCRIYIDAASLFWEMLRGGCERQGSRQGIGGNKDTGDIAKKKVQIQK